MAKERHLIAIDLGQVLVSVDHERICRRLADHTGLAAEEVYRCLFDSHPEQQFDLGLLSPEEFALTCSAVLGKRIEAAALRECWCGIFRPKHDMLAWLEALLPRATCVLVSNTNVWHWEEIEADYPLLQRLDGLFLSFREKVRKPDDAYYQGVAARWRMPNRFFIDDREENCRAAARNGFQAWWFEGLESLSEPVERFLIHE